MRCAEKKRYETKRWAKAASRRYKGKGLEGGHAYRCVDCGWWHLTTMGAEQRAVERARDRRSRASAVTM